MTLTRNGATLTAAQQIDACSGLGAATAEAAFLARPSLNDGRRLYIAHKGGAYLYPEKCLEGYAKNAADGCVVLEIDVHLTSDGVPVCMHDASVDRTTTGTGNISAMTAATFTGLDIDGLTQGYWGFSNTIKPPTLAQVLTQFGGKAIFFIEDKSATAMTAIIAALQAANIPFDQAVLCSSTVANAVTGQASGYPAMYQAGTTTSNMATAKAGGVEWIGLDQSASQATFDFWRSNGFKIATYTLTSHIARNAVIAKGCEAIYTDDPTYTNERRKARTRDQFSLQRKRPGMLPRFPDNTELSCGKFISPNYWGWTITNTGRWVLMGDMCPIKDDPNCSSFTIDAKVTLDAGTNTQYASIFVCNNTDQPFTNTGTANANEVGYDCRIAVNGNLQIHRRNADGTTTQLGGVTSPTVVLGSEIPVQIIVTPTTITWKRTDTGHTFSVDDATFRGGYFWAGGSNVTVKYRQFVVS